jgi:hypothetical protein
MTCNELTVHVPDLVEDAVDASLRAELDAHLAQCAECRDLVAGLRRIRQTAAMLERHPLPARAWTEIQARLADQADLGKASTGRWRFGSSSVWLAAAAVLLLAVSAGIWTLGRTLTSPVTAPTTATRPVNPVDSVETELQLAATHYEKAIAGLEQIANASDSPLDPTTMATVKENLAVIDRAINESRVALRANPQSQVAQENLFEAFRRKVGLLQDTIALMNEMRKGDQAGAARIVEGLNKS